jgi:DNA-binding winged helix-turn-helix (wHTH) protein
MENKDQLIPMLIIYKGTLAGSRWPVQNTNMTIGRSNDCDIVIPDRQISRYHVRIEYDGNGYLLQDLGSKNGTVVNGVSVSGRPYRLNDGDEIILASAIQIGFVAGEATLPLEDIRFASGELVINSAERSVRIGKKELNPPLSPSQFTLLSLLMEDEGKVITREEVIASVWPEVEEGVTDQAVDALVYRLRERLTELNPSHNYIVTIRGHGYRFA